jgi:hypothetical protein
MTAIPYWKILLFLAGLGSTAGLLLWGLARVIWPRRS